MKATTKGAVPKQLNFSRSLYDPVLPPSSLCIPFLFFMPGHATAQWTGLRQTFLQENNFSAQLIFASSSSSDILHGGWADLIACCCARGWLSLLFSGLGSPDVSLALALVLIETPVGQFNSLSWLKAWVSFCQLSGLGSGQDWRWSQWEGTPR